MKKTIAAIGIAVALVGCDMPFGPDWDVLNRRPMEAPERYAMQYADVEKCLDMTGDFESIHWFVADDLYRDGVPLNGYFTRPNEITMHVDAVADERAVRHEMVHHITGAGNEIHDADNSVPCDSWFGFVG